MFTDATRPQKCSSPCIHTLQQSISAKDRDKIGLIQHHPIFQISLDNHLTTSPSHWRISSNAEQTKLQMHAGICPMKASGSPILTVEDLGSQENNTGFGGLSVSDTFISQLGQDVVRGHFLLSPPCSQGTQILERIWPWSREFPYHHSKKYPQTFYKPASTSLCWRAAAWTVKYTCKWGLLNQILRTLNRMKLIFRTENSLESKTSHRWCMNLPSRSTCVFW